MADASTIEESGNEHDRADETTTVVEQPSEETTTVVEQPSAETAMVVEQPSAETTMVVEQPPAENIATCEKTENIDESTALVSNKESVDCSKTHKHGLKGLPTLDDFAIKKKLDKMCLIKASNLQTATKIATLHKVVQVRDVTYEDFEKNRLISTFILKSTIFSSTIRRNKSLMTHGFSFESSREAFRRGRAAEFYGMATTKLKNVSMSIFPIPCQGATGYLHLDRNAPLECFVFASNLSEDAGQSALVDAFPNACAIVTPIDACNKHLGYAFMCFDEKDQAMEASTRTDVIISGLPITLSLVSLPNQVMKIERKEEVAGSSKFASANKRWKPYQPRWNAQNPPMENLPNLKRNRDYQGGYQPWKPNKYEIANNIAYSLLSAASLLPTVPNFGSPPTRQQNPWARGGRNSRTASLYCQLCDMPGHTAKQCSMMQQDEFYCSFCGGTDHTAEVCPSNQMEQSNQFNPWNSFSGVVSTPFPAAGNSYGQRGQRGGRKLRGSRGGKNRGAKFARQSNAPYWNPNYDFSQMGGQFSGGRGFQMGGRGGFY